MPRWPTAATIAGVDSASFRARTMIPVRSRTNALTRVRTSSGSPSYEMPATNRVSSRVTAVILRTSLGPDDSAREARAGVARRLRLVIVRVGVNDESAADNACRAGRHGDDVEIDLDVGAPLLV